MSRILSLIICVFLLCSCEQKQIPKDQQPLFGETSRTKEEKIAHEKLLAAIKEKTGGDPDAAFQVLIIAGWKEMREGKYRSAIRRFNLAWLLQPLNPQVFHGIGVASLKMEDYHRAFKWNLMAADAGHPNAQTVMGWMYLKGLGTQRDVFLAAEWYEKAALQGWPKAQNALGIMYDFGIGVARDPFLAKEWYDKADSAGYDGPWKKFRRDQYDGWFEPESVSFEELLDISLGKDDSSKQPV